MLLVNLDTLGYFKVTFEELLGLIQQLGFPVDGRMPLVVFRRLIPLRRTLDTCLRDPERVKGFHEPLQIQIGTFPSFQG
jgi:hypothetical protein